MNNFEKWFKQMSPKVHKANVEKGFWEGGREDWECMALILTEIAEAVEADRKGRYAEDMDVFLLSRGNNIPIEEFKDFFKEKVKDTVQDELADVCIRCLDLAGSKDKKYLNYKVTSDLMPLSKFNLLGFYLYVSINAGTIIDNNLIGHLKEICMEIIGAYGSKIYDHIDLKLKYNATRGKKHGKSY